MAEPNYYCPKCGGQLQFTKNTWYSIDAMTGLSDLGVAGAAYDVYCENTCFMAEDFDTMPTGDEAMAIAKEALGLDDETLTQEDR